LFDSIKKMLSFLCILFFCSISTFVVAQSSISGKIVDSNQEPLPGASISVKGTTNGVVADANGGFILKNVAKGSTLVVSFVGFMSQELPAANGITVVLQQGDALDEVVVTGVFDKRTRMESSVAISVLPTKQIERLALGSAADLLKNIPGVFVNSSLGEIRNTVYSRGVSVGSNDGASGYYYVSMQEDGLPVTNATFGNYGPDYFLRTDATLGKLEAVRGGTASILGNNAPGGIFNYVSKTGGETFAGEARAKYGLEGDGKNPYYRMDLNFGGPLSKDKSLTYNIGGFYRQSDGARYPGYPMNNGGQMKANLVKTYKSGSLKLYAKVLNDKNAWYEFTPTINFEKPTYPEGVTQTSTVLIPAVQADFSVNESGEKLHYNSRDKIHSRDNALGLNWQQNIGDSWTVENKIRYSQKQALWNTTAVAYPFATDNFLYYAVAGFLGQMGTYSFNDAVTGKSIGKTKQEFDPTLPPFLPPFKISVLESNFPGAAIQKNSLLFNPLFFTDNKMNELIDQFTITKKFKDMSFTAGLFYANSSLHRLFSTDVGVAYSQLTTPAPSLTKITLTSLDGATTTQMTNPDGVVGGSGKSAAVSIYDLTQKQTAFFFGHNWAITPALNFDWGVRAENVLINGTNQIAAAAPSATGGADGNPLTFFDNSTGKIAATYKYDNQKVKTFSYSGGLNYKFADNQAIYTRFSEGNKAPDMDMFLNVNTAFGAANLKPIAQKVRQIELGYKMKSGNTNLFITPFYSILSNVPQQSIGQETDNLSSTYSLPILYNSITTKGIELEANQHFTKEFSVRAVATLQSSTATVFKTWIVGQNGKADDKTQDFSGNETDNNARAIIRISPAYATEKFFASLDFSYMGKRAANVPNAFSLPAYNQTNLNLGYNVTPKLQVQANINNILNQTGIMGWSAPGGFPAALDRQGFTKAQLDANPNAVYSTLSLPARAYFLTINYKF
jgi:iron complex outermembrane recepter protein